MINVTLNKLSNLYEIHGKVDLETILFNAPSVSGIYGTEESLALEYFALEARLLAKQIRDKAIDARVLDRFLRENEK